MTPRILLYGDPETFSNYWRALEAAGGQAVFTAEGGLPDECGGLLLPGGGDMDPAYYGQAPAGSNPPDAGRDAMELELLDAFVLRGKPVLGICRGMQVINVYFGGTLVQDLQGHSQVGGVDRLHAVWAEPGTFPEQLYGPRSVVNSAHHQAVDRAGQDLRISQWADDGVAEALFHLRLPIFGVQWHPERLTGPLLRSGVVDGGRVFDFFLSRVR